MVKIVNQRLGDSFTVATKFLPCSFNVDVLDDVSPSLSQAGGLVNTAYLGFGAHDCNLQTASTGLFPFQRGMASQNREERRLEGLIRDSPRNLCYYENIVALHQVVFCRSNPCQVCILQSYMSRCCQNYADTTGSFKVRHTRQIGEYNSGFEHLSSEVNTKFRGGYRK